MKEYVSEEKTLNKYELDKYILPVWRENIVYNESVMPLKNKDGTVSPIRLAYDIAEICEVRSSDLNTLYTEGRDYALENGSLRIFEDGAIPAMEYGEYYPENSKGPTKPKTGGGNILFIEGGFFHTKQIAVTYIHNDEWQGSVPEYQGDLLKKTLDKLNNKKPLRMAFLGDSIFTGCNASGTPMGGSQAPFMPAWFDMVTEQLKKTFGYDDITYVNRSRGGTKSYWGVEVVDEYIAKEKPDIAFIGFGMNDRETPLEDYFNNISEIVEKIKAQNSECEFVLTAPMLASKEAEGFYRQQYLFVNELNKLKGEGIAVMDVTAVHGRLLERKSYRDMTGNNLNHPNDFLCRVYAQTALACIVK